MAEPRPSLLVLRHWRAILLATVLAIGVGATPAAVRPALAANGLRVAADATYTLDPDAGRVRVAVEFRLTNMKPDSGGFFYFWRDILVSVQLGATSVRATDAAGALPVSTRERRSYIEADVRLRSNLLYRQTARFTLRYDLRGGAPRSDSPIRVGRAFATFGVWAWGDSGLGTVVVETPQGFGANVDGSPMDKTSEGGRQTLRAEPGDPGSFFAIVSAENPLAYGSTRVSLGGDVEIVVRAWPEDDAWDETVSETLRDALPELLDRIGLDWPVEHDLQVRERYTPSLEGYAGFFFTDTQRIEIGEDLDPDTIIHEASHAWFNQDLFTDRWIYEGLAQEYAWQVQESLGGADREPPDQPGPDDPGAIELNSWGFPEVIRDDEVSDRELYGYDASFWVVHTIVEEAGIDQMRAAFAAADGNRTAYPGAVAPEDVLAVDGWRRFLDLVQSIEGDDARIDQALLDIVLRSNEDDDLLERRDARQRYRELLAAGEGWLPGWYVREQMGAWRFPTATTRMDEATAVLALRDRVEATAADLELEPDGALRAAYESATAGLHDAVAIGDDQLEALAAIAGAEAKVEAQPDFVSQVGLFGETPRTPYEQARAAFEDGELETALASAAAATAIVTGAAAVGEQRLLLAVAIAIGVVLLLIAFAVLHGRGRRSRALAPAPAATAAPTSTPTPTASGAAPGVAAGPAGREPSATLAADPAVAPPPSSTGPPDVEGA